MTPLNAIGIEPGKIEELIGRLERATGPDWQIDDALRIAFGYPPKPWDYTAKIDSALALALVEQVLPGRWPSARLLISKGRSSAKCG